MREMEQTNAYNQLQFDRLYNNNNPEDAIVVSTSSGSDRASKQPIRRVTNYDDNDDDDIDDLNETTKSETTGKINESVGEHRAPVHQQPQRRSILNDFHTNFLEPGDPKRRRLLGLVDPKLVEDNDDAYEKYTSSMMSSASSSMAAVPSHHKRRENDEQNDSKWTTPITTTTTTTTTKANTIPNRLVRGDKTPTRVFGSARGGSYSAIYASKVGEQATPMSGGHEDDWDELSAFLDSILDVYTYRDSDMFVDEFRRLEAYLLAEHHQNESATASVEFKNQQEIIDHLNDLIKVRNFVNHIYFTKLKYNL